MASQSWGHPGVVDENARSIPCDEEESALRRDRPTGAHAPLAQLAALCAQLIAQRAQLIFYPHGYVSRALVAPPLHPMICG